MSIIILCSWKTNGTPQNTARGAESKGRDQHQHQQVTAWRVHGLLSQDECPSLRPPFGGTSESLGTSGTYPSCSSYETVNLVLQEEGWVRINTCRRCPAEGLEGLNVALPLPTVREPAQARLHRPLRPHPDVGIPRARACAPATVLGQLQK